MQFSVPFQEDPARLAIEGGRVGYFLDSKGVVFSASHTYRLQVISIRSGGYGYCFFFSRENIRMEDRVSGMGHCKGNRQGYLFSQDVNVERERNVTLVHFPDSDLI